MPRQTKKRFWQTEKFKELQKEWEKILKASGFKDQEQNGKLTQNAGNSYRTQIPEVIENKRRYYELLGHGHHQEDFSDPVEKYVMERRSQGAPLKEIRQELRAAGKKNGRETIRKIIRYYEQKWEIKKKKV